MTLKTVGYWIPKHIQQNKSPASAITRRDGNDQSNPRPNLTGLFGGFRFGFRVRVYRVSGFRVWNFLKALRVLECTGTLSKEPHRNTKP